MVDPAGHVGAVAQASRGLRGHQPARLVAAAVVGVDPRAVGLDEIAVDVAGRAAGAPAVGARRGAVALRIAHRREAVEHPALARVARPGRSRPLPRWGFGEGGAGALAGGPAGVGRGAARGDLVAVVVAGGVVEGPAEPTPTGARGLAAIADVGLALRRAHQDGALEVVEPALDRVPGPLPDPTILSEALAGAHAARLVGVEPAAGAALVQGQGAVHLTAPAAGAAAVEAGGPAVQRVVWRDRRDLEVGEPAGQGVPGGVPDGAALREQGAGGEAGRVVEGVPAEGPAGGAVARAQIRGLHPSVSALAEAVGAVRLAHLDGLTSGGAGAGPLRSDPAAQGVDLGVPGPHVVGGGASVGITAGAGAVAPVLVAGLG